MYLSKFLHKYSFGVEEVRSEVPFRVARKCTEYSDKVLNLEADISPPGIIAIKHLYGHIDLQCI